MLKEYRKTATIKAEQFDGSPEMVFKYDIFQIILVIMFDTLSKPKKVN